MRTRYAFVALLAAVWVVSAVLSEGAWRAASAATIHLLTGPSSVPCGQDANVHFTSTSVLTPHNAIVGTGAPANPCTVQDDLHQPGKSRCITTTNSSDVEATFTIQFTLPANASNVALDMLVKVDDNAEVHLNGNFVAAPCKSSQLVHSIHLAQPNPGSPFAPGVNTLSFHVVNNPNACSLTPVARTGATDGMNLQFEGDVTYDAAPAWGGLNLGWGDCGGLPASLNEAFACDTNVGIHTLVGSFVAPSRVTAMSANEIVMDVQSTGTSLVAWWGMRSGACRAGASLSANFNFTAGPFTCYDYWQAGAIGSISESVPLQNRARILGVFALPAGDPRITGILEGTEVYSFKANINNAKTTGLGACAGCLTGVCIVLNSIKLNQPAGNPNGGKYIGSPANRAYVTWQGGASANCYAATPARNTTWGMIKARYR
jgi:hypothetical protein